jgi:hypothetical protein
MEPREIIYSIPGVRYYPVIPAMVIPGCSFFKRQRLLAVFWRLVVLQLRRPVACRSVRRLDLVC